jgi:hypothetical protein
MSANYVVVQQAPTCTGQKLVRLSTVGSYEINGHSQVNLCLEQAKHLAKELNGLIARLEAEPEAPIREDSVIDSSVSLYANGNVWVDSTLTTTDAEYKTALGLDPSIKYPHPMGWTDDWATLTWLKTDINKFPQEHPEGNKFKL